MGQVTVVTGGGRGIGAAVAVRLARAGHAIGIGYEKARETAEETAAAVRAEGAACVTVRVDTSAEDQVDALFDTVAAGLGPVTGLVNNAAVTGPLGRFAETDPEVMRRVLDVNVMGALLCARRAVRDMSTRYGGAGGAIVNISSCAATTGSPGEYVHYAATKAAVDAMTNGLAKEVAAEGIRVNSVQPGMILTGMHAAMGDPERPWRNPDRVPMRRPGEPEEIAGAVAWLLSPEASYTTGAVLRVSGGL
ncbi:MULTISPECIES: SDR family oxidoreductase [Streptomyces]|uniref:SDR family oxidoreductase n=2 Tax=Streptomyces TaxID=1883 RepID=A0A3M8F1I2_9ACTN|nr:MULTISPECIES: SDR family oxidoreductase [Streptomyces]KNE80960.1 oxidoreductase [Streptomyces fradiae]OFA54648.1 oxidoreductase [Streptomyces fradiae]PQM21217.1 KR domain-containing protein [Streptomyces xinghaiensis]RKM93585.1 SDR family oxidoreductase [Streptomyces xinghaiensis]RNC71612.1 SDR family oxidoreductase [Streptomyces xinghaiensis]